MFFLTPSTMIKTTMKPYVILLVLYPYPDVLIVVAAIAAVAIYHVRLTSMIPNDIPAAPSNGYEGIYDDAVDIIISYLPKHTQVRLTKERYIAEAKSIIINEKKVTKAYLTAHGTGLLPEMIVKYADEYMVKNIASLSVPTSYYGTSRDTFMALLRNAPWSCSIDQVPNDITKEDAELIMKHEHMTPEVYVKVRQLVDDDIKDRSVMFLDKLYRHTHKEFPTGEYAHSFIDSQVLDFSHQVKYKDFRYGYYSDYEPIDDVLAEINDTITTRGLKRGTLLVLDYFNNFLHRIYFDLKDLQKNVNDLSS